MTAAHWLDLQAQDRILITGGAGFLGRVLVQQLLERSKAQLVVLALPQEKVPEHWAQQAGTRISVYRGDVTQPADVQQAMAGCRGCFHLAALVGDAGRDADHQRVTVGGTEHVMAAALQLGAAVVLVTSICSYGDAIQRGTCREDTPFGRAQGPYGRAKQGQEQLALRYRARGLPVCVVRPANIIGPGSGPWVIDACEALRQGLPALIGGGRGNAALASVHTVADFLIHAATHPDAWGRAFHVHDGLPVTWAQYFQDLAALIGSQPPASVPRALAYLGASLCEPLYRALAPRRRPPVTREALNLIAWDSRLPLDAAQALGWQPKGRYQEQLQEIGDWLRQRG